MRREERGRSGSGGGGERLAGLSGYGIALYTLPLPLLGFLSCVGLSVVYDFERSTATHCGVRNYLPSISSAIGGFTPQRYIWRLCIALHSSPRVLIAFMMYNYHRSQNPPSRRGLYMGLVNVALLIHLIELGSLMMLTNVSSSENYCVLQLVAMIFRLTRRNKLQPFSDYDRFNIRVVWGPMGAVHETSFIAFMTCSLVYMLFTCIIMRWGHASTGMSPAAAKSYWWSRTFFIANFSSFMVAIYFFYRHNKYCEPGVYTLFALTEYITVATNILFHGSAALLFGEGALTFTLKNANKKVP